MDCLFLRQGQNRQQIPRIPRGFGLTAKERAAMVKDQGDTDEKA
jgi:hypothetical protein